MRRSRYFGAALLGLLVVAAISVAAGSGRKPSMGGPANVAVRPLSTGEVMDIINRFPEMVPSDLAAQRNDTNYLVRVYGLAEVTVPLLGRAFPSARFYMGRDFHRKPSGSYMMAITGDRRYVMPGGFNQLLLGSGLQVADENIVELAEAFVISAIGNERYDPFPEITFLEAKRIKKEVSRITFDAKLKVRIGEQVEEWYFASWQGQLGLVSRGTTDGKLIKQYDLPRAESPQQRGQLDVAPSLDISVSAPSNAYLELQGAIPHYYLIVDMSGVADSFKVRFTLSGFSANATNVYVRKKRGGKEGHFPYYCESEAPEPALPVVHPRQHERPGQALACSWQAHGLRPATP